MDAAHFYDHLLQAFGETVFIDHECLRAGQHWRTRIDEVIAAAAVMVVVLSKGWCEEIQRRHREQLSDEVLREISLALDTGKTLTPLYVERADAATSAEAMRFAADSAAYRVVQALVDAHTVRWRAASRDADLARLSNELTHCLPRFGQRLIRRCQQQLTAQLDASTA